MMDLETENRIAKILLEEAAELRRRADKEGVHAYLQKPGVRGRPNSRFLTATVLGVQQANKAVEVNEMWRLRQKELELDDRCKGRSREESSSGRSHKDIRRSSSSSIKKYAMIDENTQNSCPSRKRIVDRSCSKQDEGLRDEEVEEFLQSRLKRGRGCVGSRMDETGPYPCSPISERLPTNCDERDQRVALGPAKPFSLRSKESSSSEEEHHEHERKEKDKHRSKRSEKRHSEKHKSKRKSTDKKRKRERESKSCK